MLRTTKEFLNYKVEGVDGLLGELADMVFDERNWQVRYAVVESGTWLQRRPVLVAPGQITEFDWNAKSLSLPLTKEQTLNLPPLDSQAPVSREEEMQQAQAMQKSFDNITGAFANALVLAHPSPSTAADREPFPVSHGSDLRSVKEVAGYDIVGTDESCGHVEEFIVSDDDWTLRYVVVDTRNWWPGGDKVLIAPQWIDAIDFEKREMKIRLSRDAIKQSPKYDPTTPINRDYETKLYDFHGRPHYWPGDAADHGELQHKAQKVPIPQIII